MPLSSPCSKCKKEERLNYGTICRECRNLKQKKYRENQKKSSKTSGYNWWWDLWM